MASGPHCNKGTPGIVEAHGYVWCDNWQIDLAHDM